MPNFTIQSVVTAARAKIGDNTTAGAGQISVDSEYLEHLSAAMLEVNQVLRSTPTALTVRELYIPITAGSGFLPWDLDTILPDIGAIKEIWERKVNSLTLITTIGAAGANSTQFTVTTSTAHGLAVGNEVQIYGSQYEWANGNWIVNSIPSNVQFVVSPAYALTIGGTTFGYVIQGDGLWNKVDIVNHILPQGLVQESITLVSLGDNGIHFPAVSNTRELKFVLVLGAVDNPTLTDKLIFAESKEVLALKSAILVSIAKGGNFERISKLESQLYGPGGDAGNITGGAFKLLRRAVRLQAQSIRNVRPRFRNPRTTMNIGYVR